jgi:hypothetical protein
MISLEECRERAADCERLATESRRPNDREAMLYAASRWRDIADEEENRLGQDWKTGS